jgi:hypothetical protein
MARNGDHAAAQLKAHRPDRIESLKRSNRFLVPLDGTRTW